MSYEERNDGTKMIRTSVQVKADLHELVKLSGKSFSTILQEAILREFSLDYDENDEKTSEKFKKMVEKAREIEVSRLQNQAYRAEMICNAIESARAQEIGKELAEREVKRREEEREENHRRKLVEAWVRVAKKQYFTPDKIRKWLPENDRSGDHVDEWEALPNWLSREAGETFTTDEILSFAKRYANGEA